MDFTDKLKIEDIYCGSNQMLGLYASGCGSLKKLICPVNQLTSLNLAGDTSLFELNCDHNQLSVLNLTSSKSLKLLRCEYNKLTEIDISLNDSLSKILCSNNKIPSLDLSKKVNLEFISCTDNILTELNVQNGNNSKVTYIATFHNPHLCCIQVDNPDWSPRKAIDKWTSFSTACDYSIECDTSTVTSVDFNSDEPEFKIFPNPVNDILHIHQKSINNKQVSIINLFGQVVYSIDFSSVNNLEVNTTGFKPGIYIMRIGSELSDDVMFKIIKE